MYTEIWKDNVIKKMRRNRKEDTQNFKKIEEEKFKLQGKVME